MELLKKNSQTQLFVNKMNTYNIHFLRLVGKMNSTNLFSLGNISCDHINSRLQSDLYVRD